MLEEKKSANEKWLAVIRKQPWLETKDILDQTKREKKYEQIAGDLERNFEGLVLNIVSLEVANKL